MEAVLPLSERTVATSIWGQFESRRGWMAASFGYRSPTYGWMYEQRPTADGA
jgi:hypothetical protein